MIIKKVKTEDIIEMYNSGLSLNEISTKVGLTAQGLADRLKKHGFRIRSISEALKLAHKMGKMRDQRGDKNPAWKGGRYKNKSGYIDISIGNNKKRPEHCLVWEKHNNKKIPKGWVVHHLNGIKDDNRIENLCAMSRKNHSPRSIVDPYKKRIKELELTIAKLEKENKL